jgi:uncharacterized membrane-anchored protein YitT (DUF2179 family)
MTAQTQSPSRLKQFGNTLQDYLLLTVGALFMAAAVDIFMIPNHVVSSGLTGLSMISNYLWGWPVGIVTLLLNIPLLLAGARWGGGLKFILRTIYTVIIMTAAIDLLAPRLPAIATDPLIYTCFSGVLNGIGAGLILRGQGTAGGTDIISVLLNRHFGVPFGQVYLISNSVTLVAAAMIFKIELALYALIVVFVSSRVVDAIQEGLNEARTIFIITDHPEEVQSSIIQELGRGVTMIEAQGGYTHSTRHMLFAVVYRTQFTRLKRLIASIDPQAFVVVTDAREVLGRGFRPMVQS